MVKLVVVGLGNPEENRSNTRHNLGFKQLNAVCYGPWQLFERYAACQADDVLYVKPLTGMNSSGLVVAEIMQTYAFQPHKLLVVHDDMDLQFGRWQVKFGGGNAGHNGLKSIEQELGTSDFCRLRLGIGRPADKRYLPWVLGDFSTQEIQDLSSVLATGALAVQCWADNARPWS